MKRFYNYTFRTVCIFILLMTIYAVTILDVVTSRNYANNENMEKVLSSAVLYKEIKKIEPVIGSTLTTTNSYNPIDTTGFNVLSREIGNISHFGPDCQGCGIGYVATGDYVGSGRINYIDKTFGTVRIVAADKKYPLGSILRLTYKDRVIITIVLDRGGGIGDGRKYQIDLLAESEAHSSNLGVMYGATIEALRLGY